MSAPTATPRPALSHAPGAALRRGDRIHVGRYTVEILTTPTPGARRAPALAEVVVAARDLGDGTVEYLALGAEAHYPLERTV